MAVKKLNESTYEVSAVRELFLMNTEKQLQKMN